MARWSPPHRRSCRSRGATSSRRRCTSPRSSAWPTCSPRGRWPPRRSLTPSERARRSFAASSARWSPPASSMSSTTAASRPTTGLPRCAPAHPAACATSSSTSARTYRSFGELLHTVRTGETAFDSVYGAPLFEYYAANPETEASAAARMLARTLPAAREFAASELLRGARIVVDVGGGTGTLVAEVLRHRSDMAGVLLERPGMLELAKHYLSEQGVADRCEAVERDFFSRCRRRRRLRPEVRPARLGRRAVRRHPAHLACRDGCGRASADRRAAVPSGGHRVFSAVRRPAGPDHARVRGRARAHRGGVRAAARSGEPPPREHDRADGRSAPP